MDYLLHLFIILCIYIILAVSLNLVAGYTGLLSVAHAAFYGIGAYVAALLAINYNSPFLLNIFFAIIFGGAIGAIVGVPSLRVRDDYFVIATFAFQVIFFSIFNNWVSFSGGPMGLSGIPSPVIFGLQISSYAGFLGVVVIFCALSLWIAHRIVQSPFGRVLKGIREDEIFAQAQGKHVSTYKIIIVIIGSVMASVAGVLYAYHISYIDPSSFTVMESIFIISIVIIGGSGSFWGPVIGAVVLVVLPEILRFIGLPNSVAANIRQIIYGGLLVVFMMWRPQGLFGKYSFRTGEAKE